MLCSVRSNRVHRARQYAFQTHGRHNAMPDDFHEPRKGGNDEGLGCGKAERWKERTKGVAGGDVMSGLEENGRRSRRRRRPAGAAVTVRVSDERNEESARQDEQQPTSRSPSSAVRLVIIGQQ